MYAQPQQHRIQGLETLDLVLWRDSVKSHVNKKNKKEKNVKTN